MLTFRFAIPKILIAFLGGILLAQHCGFSFSALTVVIVIVSAIVVVLRWRKHSPAVSGALYLLVFLLGIWSVKRKDPRLDNLHYIWRTECFEEKHLLAITIKQRLRKTRCERYIASITQIDGRNAKGDVVLYYNDDQILSIGSNYILFGRLNRPVRASLPNTFDYSRYLSQKGIFATLTAGAGQVRLVGRPVNFTTIADDIRMRIGSSLANTKCREAERSIIQALLFGQQQDINPAQMEEYRRAGAVHILSVSGLHVGLVLMLLTAVLKPVPNTPVWREGKFLLSLCGLWLFALLAGLAPSVVRSAAMFTLLAFGIHLRRISNIYHTLCASAFIILLYDPFLIFDVGFQLSYAAVFFIVWLQPKFTDWWQPRNPVLRYLYSLLTVSLAAQLGTMPLSLYYFHQFPTLFLVTNLLVIPLVSVLMGLGILAAVFGLLGTVPEWLATLLQWFTSLMNNGISWIAKMEYSVIEGVSMNATNAVLLYLVLISIGLSIFRFHFRTVCIAMACLIVLQIAWLYELKSQSASRQLIISERNRSLFVLSIHGRHARVLSDKHIAIEEFIAKNFILSAKSEPLDNLEYEHSRRIVRLDSVLPLHFPRANVLLLDAKSRINLERALMKLRPEVVIASASASPWKRRQWAATCLQKKIPFHDIREKGYFVLK